MTQQSLFAPPPTRKHRDPWRALSLRQPWCAAILRRPEHLAKRIENRLGWTDRYPASHFRGECFIHASAGMTRAEYEDVVWFHRDRAMSAMYLPPFEECVRGGIVGRMRVVGYVRAQDHAVVIDARTAGVTELVRDLTDAEQRWYMGGFALVLDDVVPTAFVPLRGRLGFFRVPADVAARAVPIG